MKCPKCDHNVPVLRTWRHTWWTPIVCVHCNAKLHFEKASYFRKIAPLMICLLILTPATALHAIMRNMYFTYWVLCWFLILAVLLIKLAFFDLRRMKLVAADEKG